MALLQSHPDLVSLIVPCQSLLYPASLQWTCFNLTVTLSVAPLPCQPHLSFVPLPGQSPITLLQSHSDLVSLTLAVAFLDLDAISFWALSQ